MASVLSSSNGASKKAAVGRPIKAAPKKHGDFTSDTVPGGSVKQYTNFEKKAKAEGDEKEKSERKSKTSKFEKVLEIPDDLELETKDIVIDPSKVVCYSGRGHWLSTFYNSPMSIDGHIYPSVEHYYQACKLFMLGGARCSSQIKRIPDAGSVKITARRLLHGVATPAKIEQWKMSSGLNIIEHAMIHKFVQHPVLRTKLVNTGESLLVHAYDLDAVFGAGMKSSDVMEWAKGKKGETLTVPNTVSVDTLPYFPLVGNGKNLLGMIAMRVREKIIKFQTDTRAGSPTGFSDPILAAAMNALQLETPADPESAGDTKPKKQEKSPEIKEIKKEKEEDGDD